MKKLKLNESLISDIHDYLKGWMDTESWSDLNVMLDHGDTEMAADYLVGAGAIDPDQCYLEFREIEQATLELAMRYRKLSRRARMKRQDDIFKGCFIVSCADCNHVSFLDCGNENIYPESKTNCWECKSKNIETKRGLK